jgi:death-on-curing family protein
MAAETLSVEDVLQIHRLLVEDFAATGDPIEPPGIRSRALLESAVGRQHVGLGSQLKYPSPIESASTLLYGICLDHAFHNGNKRTALVSMLVHLDKNRIGLFNVDQKELFELMLTVANHTVGLKQREIVADNIKRRNPDDEVKAIARWLDDKADKLRRGERIVTYRELRRILRSFDYEMERPDGNTIEIVKYEKRPRSLLHWREEVVRRHVTTIPYPGDAKDVAVQRIKEIRRICRLREEDGVDSTAFYDQTVVIDSFINRYRTILRRLARR